MVPSGALTCAEVCLFLCTFRLLCRGHHWMLLPFMPVAALPKGQASHDQQMTQHSSLPRSLHPSSPPSSQISLPPLPQEPGKVRPVSGHRAWLGSALCCTPPPRSGRGHRGVTKQPLQKGLTCLCALMLVCAGEWDHDLWSYDHSRGLSLGRTGLHTLGICPGSISMAMQLRLTGPLCHSFLLGRQSGATAGKKQLLASSYQAAAALPSHPPLPREPCAGSWAPCPGEPLGWVELDAQGSYSTPHTNSH